MKRVPEEVLAELRERRRRGAATREELAALDEVEGPFGRLRAALDENYDADFVEAIVRSAFVLLESPIEERLLVGLVAASAMASIDLSFEVGNAKLVIGYQYEHPGQTPLVVRPQVWIGDYRADFVVECVGTKVVVECDGHDFHERTKEQARRDRKRDRDMQGIGLSVLRFTGSEIHADEVACGRQIVDFIMKRPVPPEEVKAFFASIAFDEQTRRP